MLADILINVFVARGHVFGRFFGPFFGFQQTAKQQKTGGPGNGTFLGAPKMTFLWPQKVLADILINVFVARGHVFGSFLKAHFRVVYPIKH